MPSDQPDANATPAAQPAQAAQNQVRLDISNLKSSYCNFCNATATREEVVLNFGINSNWELGQKDMEVQLQHRIILNPYAAKRLQELLAQLVREHESRYGELK